MQTRMEMDSPYDGTEGGFHPFMTLRDGTSDGRRLMMQTAVRYCTLHRTSVMSAETRLRIFRIREEGHQ